MAARVDKHSVSGADDVSAQEENEAAQSAMPKRSSGQLFDGPLGISSKMSYGAGAAPSWTTMRSNPTGTTCLGDADMPGWKPDEHMR